MRITTSDMHTNGCSCRIEDYVVFVKDMKISRVYMDTLSNVYWIRTCRNMEW